MALIVVASFVAALFAARIAGTDGPWLWNLDIPKIDYPLASFFHDALMHGHLPLWNDQLGLGYPLYAEGQIGAFYPPNWFIYLLPPLEALDVTRVLHLTLAGTGAGLIALRLGGGRYGAILAAAAVVLSGGIVSKLEWTNFLVAYGWLPWVLLPLMRRNGPTRAGLVAAGTLWGIQALAGHPNLWLFTGIAAVTLMLATTPRLITLARVAGFGLLGGAIGSMQLLPTLLLTPLSVRSTGLSANDLFASSSTPLDFLSFGFANVFVQSSNGSWNLGSTWYPNGPFALLETTAYVGLPILVLAALAVTVRRVRPFVAVGVVMAAIPIVAAFRPWFWSEVPILDALRSPVRTYVVVDMVIALLAAVGLARIGRQRGAWFRIASILAVMLGGYALVALLAQQGSLADLLRPFSIFSSPVEFGGSGPPRDDQPDSACPGGVARPGGRRSCRACPAHRSLLGPMAGDRRARPGNRAAGRIHSAGRTRPAHTPPSSRTSHRSPRLSCQPTHIGCSPSIGPAGTRACPISWRPRASRISRCSAR